MEIEIPDATAEVLAFPIKPRDNNIERVLTEVHSYQCAHRRFTIVAKLAQVTCSDCKERMDPMYALIQLVRQETSYHELHARYQDEMQRLAERSKTKCQHCGQITKISKA
jgi:hypothetical protein